MPHPIRGAALLLLVGLGSFACAAHDRLGVPSGRTAPYVVVLGTAQDGGLPQLGCERSCCRRARVDASATRLVTSLLLVDPRSGSRWLFDATPDLARQVERAREHAPPAAAVGRPPLFDGIFLTHAHIGHYLGLAQLGPEVYGAEGQPVYVTERMEGFLCDEGPWSLLVERGSLELRPLRPDRPVELAPDLRVVPLLVPHRDEFSDTVGFVIEGPERSLLYLPDIDKWERWQRPLEQVLAAVDVALVDATFYGPDELPGRDMAAIPHPFIVETLARIAPLPAAERDKVHFTHLNHSNPAADPASAAARHVQSAGARVASEGDVHAL